MEPQRDSAAATSTETSLLLEASNILQLLPNATGFKLVGGQVVLGNVNNHQSPVSVALGSTQTLPSPPAVASNAGPIRRPSPPRRLAASEIYCEKLLYEQRGFPLYVPQPHMHLPEEYRRTGVAIGDVGRVTPEGAFDFLFNIYCPREHPINANGVPENFSPLPPYLVSDLFCLDYAPGDYVSTLSVEELDAESSDDFPGGEFGFKCNGPDGAVLALPHGARLEKLENLETMLRYAAKNAESWYKHINGPGGRGRQLVNGFLYLITGCEKSQSWGMASFQNIAAEREFQLRFKPNADATAGWKYRWRKGTPARTKCFMNSAEPNLANQTLFLHGFSISLGEGIWGKLFGDVSVGPIADFRGGKSRSQLVPFGSQGSSGSRSLGLGSRTAQNGHDMDALRSAPADQEDEDVQLCHFSPTPTFLHPSQLVNSYLTQKALDFPMFHFCHQ
ncbi:hypothetical protein B0H19DRAFT_1259642 [Mycena capillaripes]|nr:hypothetical protein B0H19DRAFT_1259642 [Mycena capillaripes]